MRRWFSTFPSKTAGGLLVLLLSFASHAQSDAAWEAEKSAITKEEIGTTESCQKIWDFYWRWAKSGKVEARVDLWKLVSLGWLRPPGINQDTETLLRHHYTFLIHSIASDDPAVLEAFRRMPSERGMTKFSAQPYLECVTADDKRRCVGTLVQRGLVADFDAYARELDLLAAAPGAQPVHCPEGAFHFPRLRK